MTQRGGAHYHMLSLLSFALLYSCANALNRREELQAMMVRHFAKIIARMCQEQAQTHTHTMWPRHGHTARWVMQLQLLHSLAKHIPTPEFCKQKPKARLHTYVDGRNDTEQCLRRVMDAFDKVSRDAPCKGTNDNEYVMA